MGAKPETLTVSSLFKIFFFWLLRWGGKGVAKQAFPSCKTNKQSQPLGNDRGHWIREPECLGRPIENMEPSSRPLLGTFQSRFKHFQEPSKPIHCIFVHCGSWEHLFLIVTFLSQAEYYTMTLYLCQYFSLSLPTVYSYSTNVCSHSHTHAPTPHSSPRCLSSSGWSILYSFSKMGLRPNSLPCCFHWTSSVTSWGSTSLKTLYDVISTNKIIYIFSALFRQRGVDW